VDDYTDAPFVQFTCIMCETPKPTSDFSKGQVKKKGSKTKICLKCMESGRAMVNRKEFTCIECNKVKLGN